MTLCDPGILKATYPDNRTPPVEPIVISPSFILMYQRWLRGCASTGGQPKWKKNCIIGGSAALREDALCKLVFIDERGDDYVILDGVRFSSRILRVNVSQADRAFAAVASCGPEIETWSEQLDDPLHRYWSEAMRLQALGAASQALVQEIDQRYRPGHMAAMNPGSLSDWPLREQRPLFALLGDAETAIGFASRPADVMTSRCRASFSRLL